MALPQWSGLNDVPPKRHDHLDSGCDLLGSLQMQLIRSRRGLTGLGWALIQGLVSSGGEEKMQRCTIKPSNSRAARSSQELGERKEGLSPAGQPSGACGLLTPCGGLPADPERINARWPAPPRFCFLRKARAHPPAKVQPPGFLQSFLLPPLKCPHPL